MRSLVLTVFFAALAVIPVAQAGTLPGQASRYCAFSASAALDAATASERSPYLGIFDGKWESVLPATLIIYEVKGTRAKGYYAWKAFKAWNVAPGCRAVEGRITSSGLQFRGTDTMSFKVRGSGLDGVYVYLPGTANEFVERSRFTRKR